MTAVCPSDSPQAIAARTQHIKGFRQLPPAKLDGAKASAPAAYTDEQRARLRGIAFSIVALGVREATAKGGRR